MQASSHSSQGVFGGRVSVAGVSVLRHETRAEYFVVEWTRANTTLLLQHPSQSQQAVSRVQHMMSTFCDLTCGVGRT